MCLLCRAALTAARSAGYMRPAVARWAYTSRSTSQASPHFRERVTLGTTIASTVSDALAVSRRSGWHLTGAGRSGCLTGALVPQPIQMCDQGTRPGFDIGPPRRGAQQQRLREDAAATGSHCIMHFALRPRTGDCSMRPAWQSRSPALDLRVAPTAGTTRDIAFGTEENACRHTLRVK